MTLKTPIFIVLMKPCARNGGNIMPDNYDFIQSCLDQFQFITVNGKALDLDLNEYRDENGQIVYVPIEFRSLFKTVELSE